MSPETNVGQKVIRLLGNDIVLQDSIDRSRIAKKVFSNPKLLKALEQIIHPVIRDELEKHYRQAIQKGDATLFVAEIPLLFESNFGSYDYTIAVVASENTCKRRFIQKTGYGEEEYNRRMLRQLSPSVKAKRANFVILNEDGPEELRIAVMDVYNKIVRECKE